MRESPGTVNADMNEERTSLYYKDAGSDKEYHVQLVAQDGGFMVTYQNGRRGGALAQGRKTAAPVAYDVAKKAYDKIVKEKLSKGYTRSEAGAVFSGGELEARFTGIVPQLLNPVEEAAVEVLFTDPVWVLQEKHDGHRRLVQRTEQQTVGINRKGMATGLPREVAEAVASFSACPLVLDGELVGSVLAVFDVLEHGHRNLRGLPYGERLAVLEALGGELAAGQGSGGIFITKTARDEASKRTLYAALKAGGLEGGVFKRLDAAYVAGRPHSGGNQLKCKFTHTASFIVTSAHATRRSVALGLLDESGGPYAAGNCTIPSNYAIPPAGAIVEVEYLYAFPGGSVFQPQYKGLRDDVDAAECRTAQLHFKAVATDEDEEGASGPA
jgi:bifunctional non-homologous end joining protein LigD